MSTVEILDVGHGNCSLISSKDEYAIVDSPRRDPLLSLLKDRGITRIGAVVVSHADADHLAGVEALLYDDQIMVERLFVNPEQTRPSGVWATFKVAAARARNSGTRILSATRDSAELITVSSEVALEVVSPTGVDILAGPGGKVGRKTYTANGLSIVIRVIHDSIGRVLLPADMDAPALEEILSTDSDIKADVLVFPHHGGHSGGNPSTFSVQLLEAVQPRLVVFSLGQKYSNPIPETLNPAIESRTRVCCTGLARPCEPSTARAASCAGTVTVDLTSGLWDAAEDEMHKRFVDGVTQPLCRRARDS